MSLKDREASLVKREARAGRREASLVKREVPEEDVKRISFRIRTLYVSRFTVHELDAFPLALHARRFTVHESDDFPLALHVSRFTFHELRDGRLQRI